MATTATTSTTSTLDPKTLAEIQRKATYGEKLAAPDAQKQAIYDQFRSNMTNEVYRKADSGIDLTDQNNAYNVKLYNDRIASNNAKTGSESTGKEGFQAPSYSAMDYATALSQANQQLDPLYQRAVENIKSQQWQNNLNAGETASAHGGAHSGLAADLQNKVNIAAASNIADADAQRSSKAAEIAQALVARSEDRADGLRQQAFNEYLGQANLDLSRDQFDYSKQSDTRNYNRSVFESDRAYKAQQAQQEWENNFNQSQFDWSKAQQIWENAFQEKNFQQSVKQFAANMGYNWASLSQRQQESLANQAFQQKQFEADQYWKQKSFDWETSPNNPSNSSKTPQPSENQILSEYVSNLDSLTPDKIKSFFSDERSKIINDLGANGFNQLYGMYFDQYGIPKSK
ncbi:hypothetical protein [Cohnella sp. AR92]|uniref:hypothetical protein n=1 Tax=Cohnella sp. AR92 TaxID=648716 RepID=UPI000F8D285D|nr:hypothetical protein [Cohnella sp. AR92]RUS42264.1 hypothetical protein ELR57_27005 [Cohnella sp. AR92]